MDITDIQKLEPGQLYHVVTTSKEPSEIQQIAKAAVDFDLRLIITAPNVIFQQFKKTFASLNEEQRVELLDLLKPEVATLTGISS